MTNVVRPYDLHQQVFLLSILSNAVNAINDVDPKANPAQRYPAELSAGREVQAEVRAT